MTNSNSILPTRAARHYSPFPNFMIMVHSAATVFSPDDDQLRKKAHDFESAFVEMWEALALRASVSNLNDGHFPLRHDQHEPNPEALDASDANVGTAFLELCEVSEGDSTHERLQAFSRNHIKGVGSVDLPEGWLPVASEPRYPGLGRNACTEHRLINELARRYTDATLKGSLRIYTERVPCASCQKVLCDFAKDYPNLSIDVTYTYGGDPTEEKEAIRTLSDMGIDVHSVRRTTLKASAK